MVLIVGIMYSCTFDSMKIDEKSKNRIKLNETRIFNNNLIYLSNDENYFSVSNQKLLK